MDCLFLLPHEVRIALYTPAADEAGGPDAFRWNLLTEPDAGWKMSSLGMILYRTMNQGQEPFLVFGKPCYSSQEKEMALNRRMDGKVLPKPRAASEELANIILKACAFDPEDRYSSASSFKEALLGLRKDKESPRSSQGREGGA